MSQTTDYLFLTKTEMAQQKCGVSFSYRVPSKSVSQFSVAVPE